MSTREARDDEPRPMAVIPFGKHRGTPVDVLKETDPRYLDWLTAQEWFREKYANVYQIIINRGGETEETPEHNALQLLWLDEEFRHTAVFAVTGFAPHDCCVNFESDAIDVLLTCDLPRIEPHVFDFTSRCVEIVVELKPELRDDYPAAVRQVRRYVENRRKRAGQRGLPAIVCNEFRSSVATLEQVGRLFPDVRFLTVAQIEALRPQYRHAHTKNIRDWLTQRIAAVDAILAERDVWQGLFCLDDGDADYIVDAVESEFGCDPCVVPIGMSEKDRRAWEELREELVRALLPKLRLALSQTLAAQSSDSAPEIQT